MLGDFHILSRHGWLPTYKETSEVIKDKTSCNHLGILSHRTLKCIITLFICVTNKFILSYYITRIFIGEVKCNYCGGFESPDWALRWIFRTRIFRRGRKSVGIFGAYFKIQAELLFCRIFSASTTALQTSSIRQGALYFLFQFLFYPLNILYRKPGKAIRYLLYGKFPCFQHLFRRFDGMLCGFFGRFLGGFSRVSR